MPASTELKELVALYKATPIEYQHLKPVSLAMWILESGWGASELAKRHNNFAGIKWRREMAPFATRVMYAAHDGRAAYCNFNDRRSFINGFWAFLERTPYRGWRDHAEDGESFIGFVGDVWAEDAAYIEKVIDLTDEAESLLNASGGAVVSLAGEFACEECGPGESAASNKPRVDRWEPTSHQSSRNNTDIDHIVVHYTTSRNIEGSISWFKHGDPRTSAHYIVGRDGALVQMVNDSDRAWHAGTSGMNARSIGIEHVAAPGDEITSQQAETSAKLIAWLMREYEVPKAQVIPHVCVKPTSCCGDLFKSFGGGANRSCDVQRTALHKWLSSVGI